MRIARVSDSRACVRVCDRVYVRVGDASTNNIIDTVAISALTPTDQRHGRRSNVYTQLSHYFRSDLASAARRGRIG